MMANGIVAVVDDTIAILNLMTLLLGAAGFVVRTYTSPYALLDDDGCQPDCLIIDQQMPGMTGLEVVARWRQAGITVPVLLMSGLLSDDILAHAADLKIDLVLEKPLDIDVLLKFAARHC